MLGVSLGGHCAWHCLLHEPKIQTGVVVIGTADYARLMHSRARDQNRASYHGTTPKGSSFLGSADFPQKLIRFVESYDPVGFLLGNVKERIKEATFKPPTPLEMMTHVRPRMAKHLRGKHILNIAGGADTLVPYSASAPFLRWLKSANMGWFRGHGLVLVDSIHPGIKHDVSIKMVKEATQFITASLQGQGQGRSSEKL